MILLKEYFIWEEMEEMEDFRTPLHRPIKMALAVSQGLVHGALDVVGAPYWAGLIVFVVVMPLINYLIQRAFVFELPEGRR